MTDRATKDKKNAINKGGARQDLAVYPTIALEIINSLAEKATQAELAASTTLNGCLVIVARGKDNYHLLPLQMQRLPNNLEIGKMQI